MIDLIETTPEKAGRRGVLPGDIARIIALDKIYRKNKEQIIREYFQKENPRLTRREIGIARLAAAGATNNEIGQQLYITTNTFKMALKSIYAKLSIHSRSLLHQHLHDLGL